MEVQIDAMIDLETLATEQDAVVASIGVVLMDMTNLAVLPSTFYSVLNWDEQLEMGRKVHTNTVQWWLRQERAAQEGILQPPLADNATILSGLRNMLPKGAGIWGNGADFDCVIMQSLYKTYRIKAPWGYSKHRCFRTVKNMSQVAAPERIGTHHNALDDAIFQANWLMEILRANRT